MVEIGSVAYVLKELLAGWFQVRWKVVRSPPPSVIAQHWSQDAKELGSRVSDGSECRGYRKDYWEAVSQDSLFIELRRGLDYKH